jgi:hypothetical protein
MSRIKFAVVALAALAATSATAQEPRTDRSPALLTGRDLTYLTVYTQQAMSGGAFSYTEADGNLGSMTRVESLRTIGGAWQICDQHGFRGECRVVDGRYRTLSETGLREIRSLRPVPKKPAS